MIGIVRQPLLISLKTIMLTFPCNVDRLAPHFYINKSVGFKGVYIIFLFLLLTIDSGYSLESPQCFEHK